MRAKAIEIRWHWKELSEPVLAIDHHPTVNRIATAGSDNAIKVWSYTPTEDGFFAFTFLSCLCLEAQPVNVIKFLPRDDLLLSGHDGGLVVLWCKSERHVTVATTFETLHEDQKHNQETWVQLRRLRGHAEDVYSLAVSPDMHFAASGSIDSSIIVWDLASGRASQKLDDHAHYVQGLVWDPLNVYFASQSSDRRINFYVDGLKKLQAPNARTPSRRREGRFELDTSVDRDLEESSGPRYFRDETACTFFRRLHWSPDGLFVVSVCGQFKEDITKDEITNCAYVFLRGVWDSAFICLPIPDEDNPEPVVGARWSPVFYKCRNSLAGSPWELDQYRMVFALFTLSTLFIYDTSSAEPIAMVSNIHLSTITDAVWSPDGRTLMVASKDGYVSCIAFSDAELGATWDMGSDMEDLPTGLQEVKRIRAELEEELEEQTPRLLRDLGPTTPRPPKASSELAAGTTPTAALTSTPNATNFAVDVSNLTPKATETSTLMDMDSPVPSKPVVQDPSSLFDE